MSGYLRLVQMPTEQDLEQRRRRRAWWLRVARESRGLSQSGVAEALGLSRKSASTVGDWERQVSDPSLRQLEQLAALYGVPVSLFMDPPMTDEERLAELAAAAIAAEQLDWASRPEPGRDAGGGPSEPPRRRAS